MSAHRHAAFEACTFLMDHLKTQAPFWKKETTPQGMQWVDAREADVAAMDRWSIRDVGKRLPPELDIASKQNPNDVSSLYDKPGQHVEPPIETVNGCGDPLGRSPLRRLPC